MKTLVEHVSPTKVKLTITLGKKELDAAQQVALTKLAKEMKVPGFRKGKVPASVAMKSVDPNLLAQQTADDALSKAVAEAFLKEEIQALDRPEVELKKFVPGQEMEFTAESEVLPKVILGDYKKLKVKKEKSEVTDSDIKEILERMRDGMSDKKEVSRAAKNGDEVIIDFTGKKDGVAFEGGTAENYELKLGSNSFIPGFEEGIVGKKPGDTFDLKLAFPKEYHVAELAGADVTFTTTLKKINELIKPPLDDAFAQKADTRLKTLEELKNDIKTELSTQKERESENKLKDTLVEKLIEVSEIPVPQTLLDDQARSIEQDMTQNLMYQGLTIEQYISNKGFKDRDHWRTNEVTPAAEKRVKAGLALAEL
ncbi:MAG: trigger factor, partial [Patescibacteria group bacterium]|nr:trigger factor [Patescibacteria group bacterium]